MNFHEVVYIRIRCICMCVSVFISLCIPEMDICIDMYTNRSLFFRMTFEVGQELVSASLCLTKQGSWNSFRGTCSG